MNGTTLDDAAKKAREFLSAVKKLREADYENGQYSAAVRRRSMDLTRALAQLRKHE